MAAFGGSEKPRCISFADEEGHNHRGGTMWCTRGDGDDLRQGHAYKSTRFCRGVVARVSEDMRISPPVLSRHGGKGPEFASVRPLVAS
ncbi:hypothetical protein E4U56_007642, partial [Claviceps arundinis]